MERVKEAHLAVLSRYLINDANFVQEWVAYYNSDPEVKWSVDLFDKNHDLLFK